MNTEQSPLRAEAVQRLKTNLCAGREPEGAQVIYAGRNRLYTVALPDGTVACVKDFKRAGLLKGIIYGFFRDSKAHRSFDNARRLLDMGFDTPAPLGWCETHKRLGLLDRAYYICEFRPDVAETRCWEEWPDRDAFVDALGREMARLFRVPWARRLRYIHLPALEPFLLAGCSTALGMSWKAGVAAEVIGVVGGSIGERLYEAKIYLETADLLAWTVVIVAVSALFERLFLALLRRGFAALRGGASG